MTNELVCSIIKTITDQLKEFDGISDHMINDVENVISDFKPLLNEIVT